MYKHCICICVYTRKRNDYKFNGWLSHTVKCQAINLNFVAKYSVFYTKKMDKSHALK